MKVGDRKINGLYVTSNPLVGLYLCSSTTVDVAKSWGLFYNLVGPTMHKYELSWDSLKLAKTYSGSGKPQDLRKIIKKLWKIKKNWINK